MPGIAASFLRFALADAVLLTSAAFWLRHHLMARKRLTPDVHRIRREDALKHLGKAEANSRRADLDSVAGALHLKTDQAAALLGEMEQHGLLSFAGGELHLTPAGRQIALHIVRAHRLWEHHLAERTSVPPAKWHAVAEIREHTITPTEAAVLSADLGHPLQDPHGDAIPSATGVLAGDAGQPLNTLASGRTARIAHIEDEPETIHARLAAEGLQRGAIVRVQGKSDRQLHLLVDGNECTLAPILAQNVDVIPLPEGTDPTAEKNLANLAADEQGIVLGLSPDCHGAERRRLLDLGFVPGTGVGREMASPTGDPTAYRVRGTVIALRREQARLVRVSMANNTPA